MSSDSSSVPDPKECWSSDNNNLSVAKKSVLQLDSCQGSIYVLESTPEGEGISADVIWGKKNMKRGREKGENAKEKKKGERKRKKGEQK